MRSDAGFRRNFLGVGNIYASASPVKTPAMVGAANRIALDMAAIGKVCSEVGTNVVDDADLPIRSTKHGVEPAELMDLFNLPDAKVVAPAQLKPARGVCRNVVALTAGIGPH